MDVVESFSGIRLDGVPTAALELKKGTSSANDQHFARAANCHGKITEVGGFITFPFSIRIAPLDSAIEIEKEEMTIDKLHASCMAVFKAPYPLPMCSIPVGKAFWHAQLPIVILDKDIQVGDPGRVQSDYDHDLLWFPLCCSGIKAVG